MYSNCIAQDQFEIKNMNNLITTTEFATYAPEVDTARYSAPTISGFIGMASQQVADYLQYDPLAADVVAEVKNGKVTSEGDLLIFPARVPVISISSLEILKGTVAVSLNLTSGDGTPRYNLDFGKRHIRYAGGELSVSGSFMITNLYNLRGQQFYTRMSYRAGFEVGELPDVIKLATSLYVRDILARSQNTSGAQRISQGGITLDFAEKKGKSELIQDAERLLASYVRIG